MGASRNSCFIGSSDGVSKATGYNLGWQSDATSTNEAVEFSKTSPLELVLARPGCPKIVLNILYRMCPVVSSIVQRFYPSGLINHESLLKDNHVRQKMRAISKRYYKNVSPYGSEVITVNVDRGISRNEPNGRSLKSYANLDTIRETILRYKEHGIPSSQVTDLSCYRGQKNLDLARMDHSLFLDVGTVDSYQGKENEVVFLSRCHSCYAARVFGHRFSDLNIRTRVFRTVFDRRCSEVGVR